MKTIGYFDGTDSMLLTKLAAYGFCTFPLGNEWDGHGKIVTNLEPGDVDLIITYLHKLLPPRDTVKGPIPTPVDLLFRAKTHSIPIFVVVPTDLQEKAKDLLGEAADFVRIVTPQELDQEVSKNLGL
ncbi:MAG: hypothetical protein ACW98U_13210 [Candidatus Thorarchaeota archaeon]|jgi:hypothetical protein